LIKVGALLSLSGALASSGQGESLALDLAAEDINTYLAGENADFRIEVVKADTQTDPEVALEQLQALTDQGIQVFVGPDTSEEAFRVLPWANWFDRIIISPASTAPSLAIEDDNLFRMVPDDTHQALAMANHIWENGHRILLPCFRDDQYATDLITGMKVNVTMLGGTMKKGLRYDPENFSAAKTVGLLSGHVQQTAERYGVSALAVYLVAFEEGVDLMRLAAADGALDDMRWYGNESLALNASLVEDEKVAAFAAARQFTCPEYFVEGSLTEKIHAELETMEGHPPEAFALAAYDALWLIAKAYQQTGRTTDPEALKRAITAAAAEFDGATGLCTLNAAGDRDRGAYHFWQVREENGAYRWVQVDSYRE
jgi:branched-chain amino acid transport system substrate-binding protein